MVKRTPRPSASAATNFLREYCMAPAASRKGTIGKGGGNKAGTATAKNPQRSKRSKTLLALRFESFARMPPCRLSAPVRR